MPSTSAPTRGWTSSWSAPGRWPRRAFGGLGAAQAIPDLSQYWHPWLLRARVRGTAVIDGREIDLDGAVAYAEKNWSNGGFPETWWWGQAHGFADDPDACVAFAGGRAGVGALRMVATSLVIRAGGELVRLVRPLQPLRVAVDGAGGASRVARRAACRSRWRATPTARHHTCCRSPPRGAPPRGRRRAAPRRRAPRDPAAPRPHDLRRHIGSRGAAAREPAPRTFGDRRGTTYGPRETQSSLDDGRVGLAAGLGGEALARATRAAEASG